MNTPHNTETTERIQAALDFALEASKVAARTVIDAFMNGEEPPSSGRYLLSMNWNPRTRRFDDAHVKAIKHDAFIMSLDDLTRVIGEPDYMVESAKLAGLARASIQRLKSRLVREPGHL
jgi:hypothetical protein